MTWPTSAVATNFKEAKAVEMISFMRNIDGLCKLNPFSTTKLVCFFIAFNNIYSRNFTGPISE